MLKNQMGRIFSFIIFSILFYQISAQEPYSVARLSFFSNQNRNCKINSRVKIDSNSIINTHIELLKSKAVISGVAHALKGKKDVNEIARNVIIRKAIDTLKRNICIEILYPKSELSAKIANTLCEFYLDWKKKYDLQSTNRYLEPIHK
jgi:capsular polysaccharide biosynthesis protein